MLLSAYIAGGPPRRVIEAAREGEIELVLPERALEELTRVLTKLGAPRDEIVVYIELLAEIGDTAPSPRGPAVTGERGDDAILACAVAVRAAILVTGDRRHLLPLNGHEGVRIMAPQAVLAELRGV